MDFGSFLGLKDLKVQGLTAMFSLFRPLRSVLSSL